MENHEKLSKEDDGWKRCGSASQLTAERSSVHRLSGGGGGCDPRQRVADWRDCWKPWLVCCRLAVTWWSATCAMMKVETVLDSWRLSSMVLKMEDDNEKKIKWWGRAFTWRLLKTSFSFFFFLKYMLNVIL